MDATPSIGKPSRRQSKLTKDEKQIADAIVQKMHKRFLNFENLIVE